MEEFKEETTSEKPEETETSEEKTVIEGQETSERKPETSEEMIPRSQVDRLYKRMKDAEERTKVTEEKLQEALQKKSGGEVDLDELADRLSALQGLDSIERARLLRESKLQGTPLEEARKSEDFKLWRSAYRAKIEQEKTAKPSTRQSITTAEKPWDEMSSEEQIEWIKGIKILNPKTGKYEPAQLLPRAYYRPKR